MARVFSYLAS